MREVKLILAVVQDDDTAALMDSLIEHDLSATKLASTGGFLLRGNTTLMIGVDDSQVEEVVSIIRRACQRRKKLMPQTSTEMPTSVSLPIEVEAGGGILFVLDVTACHRI